MNQLDHLRIKRGIQVMRNIFNMFYSKKSTPIKKNATILSMELLEDRTVPTVISFTGPTNLNPEGSSNPDQFTQVDSSLYFTANNNNSTRQLFRYDSGTKATQVSLNGSGGTYINPELVIDAGRRLFTEASAPDASGKGLFAVIAPKTTSLVVQGAPTTDYKDMVSFGLNAYFLAESSPNTNSLYRTVDHYNSNNVLDSISSTLVTGSTSTAPWNNPQHLLIDGPNLYMVDQSPNGSLGIFQINLSNDQSLEYASFGVTQIVGYTFTSISDLSIQNGNLFFNGVKSGAIGSSIFTLQQNAGALSEPTQLTQPISGSIGSTILPVDVVGPMRFVNGQVFFAGNAATGGTELYQTNGTQSGTKLALDINPNGDGLDPINGLTQSVVVPNGLLLSANGGITTTIGTGSQAQTTYVPVGVEPASIPIALDGTIGKINFIDINPGASGSNPTNFSANNYQGFFAANDPTYGNELFTSQGTKNTTFLLKNFNTTIGGSSNPNNLSVQNGVLYLSANNGTSGFELYVGNTYQTRTTAAASTQTPNINSLVNVNGTVFYVVGSDLWASTGTLSGTYAVTTGSALANYSPQSLRSFNNSLYFLKSNATNNQQLYASQGTAKSTPTAINLVDGSGNNVVFSSSAKVVDVFNNFLYINDNGNLYQVSSSGVAILKATNYVESNGTANSVAGKSIVNANGTLFFAGKESQGNYSLYKLGPADASAVKLGSIPANPGTSQPINFSAVEGRVFFTALDAYTGNSLFSTTGIINSTTGRANIDYILSLDASTTINSFGANVFFGSPTNSAVGNEPWVSNGTLSGTKYLKNINLNLAGAAPSNPSIGGIVSGRTFSLFAAGNQGTGQSGNPVINYEPYIITGYDVPVVTLLKDLNPGNLDSNPADFTPVDNQMFFSATTTVGGISSKGLFVTQGTANTTSRIFDSTGAPTGVDSIVAMEGNVAFRALGAGSSTLWTSNVDALASPVQNIVRSSPTNIRVDSPPIRTVTFNVRFNFDIDPSSVDANDFIVVKDSTLGTCTISNVAPVVTNGIVENRSYLVTVTLPTKAGTFGSLTINVSPTAQVRAVAPGNPVVDLSLPFPTPEKYEINPQNPKVSSITRYNPATSTASGPSVVFLVTFSQDITPSSIVTLPPTNPQYQSSIDTANNNFIAAVTGNVSLPAQPISAVEALSGSPRQFLVQVKGYSGSGTLQLQVSKNATFVSTSGLPYAQGGYTAGQFYTLDLVAPQINTITRFDPATETTSAPQVTFQTSFSESLDPSSVTTTSFLPTGIQGATVNSVQIVSGTTIPNSVVNVTLNVPITNGTLGLSLSPNATIRDAAGNLVNTTIQPTIDETYSVVRQAPTVNGVTRFNPTSQIATGSSVTYLVSFSQAMNPSTIVPTAFALQTVGTSGTVSTIIPQPGNINFEVTVSNLGGNGSLGLVVLGNSGIQDANGNNLNVTFSAGQLYTLNDNTPPTCLSMIQQQSTVPNTVLAQVTFSEAVTGLLASAFTAITSTGQSVPVTLVNPPPSGAFSQTWSIQAAGLTGSGSLTITFTNTGTVSDQAGNTIVSPPIGSVISTLVVPFRIQKAKPIVTTCGYPGTPGIVQVNGTDGSVRTFTPFKNFLGGIRATTGDFNGDGTQDIVVAAGLNGNGNIRVFDGKNLKPIKDFFPYDYYQGGVSVATADLNADGFDDIISGVTSAYPNTSANMPAHVVAFDAKTGRVLTSFYAYDTGFLGGVNVAGGDVNGDGKGEIVTTPAFGAPGHVKVFSISAGGVPKVIQSYMTTPTTFGGGVWVAVGDFDNDGYSDVATGLNLGAPFIQVNSGKNPAQVLDSIVAFNPQVPSGARVGTSINTQGVTQLLIMPGYKSSPLVSIQEFTPYGFQQVDSFFANFISNNQGGIPG